MKRAQVRLLIAEDEDAIRDGIENYVRANAHVISEIYTAADGSQAMDIILRYRPQVMLLDIQMPIKDGLAVMREACAANLCPKTVILSGHDQFSYAQQALRYGAADYMLKPCRASEMLTRLETLAREVAAKAGESAETSLGDNTDNRDKSARGNGIVEKALEYMEAYYTESLTLPLVAEKTGVSPNYLSALFGKTAHMGFADKLNQIRIERACDYFAAGGVRTYEVAYKVGFKDEKYFSSVFKKLKGVSPSEYKKNRGIAHSSN